MNVVNICRSRSGDADPSCSCRNRVGSILDGAVIAWFSCRTVEGLQEDHAVAALLVYATPITRPAVHHSAGLHFGWHIRAPAPGARPRAPAPETRPDQTRPDQTKTEPASGLGRAARRGEFALVRSC